MKPLPASWLIVMLVLSIGSAAQPSQPEPEGRQGPQAQRLAAQLQALLGTHRGHLYLPGAAPQPLMAQLHGVFLQVPGPPVLLAGGYRVLSGARAQDASTIALLITAGEGGELVAAGALRPGCWRGLQPPRQRCTARGTLTLFTARGVGRLPALEEALRDWADERLRVFDPPTPSRSRPARVVVQALVLP